MTIIHLQPEEPTHEEWLRSRGYSLLPCPCGDDDQLHEDVATRRLILKSRELGLWATPSLPVLEGDEEPSPLCDRTLEHTCNDSVLFATHGNGPNQELVCIKYMPASSMGLRYGMILDAPHLRVDPRNHAVPVFEMFPNYDGTMAYTVLPFLQSVELTQLRSTEQILDFVSQLLQGLEFMHEQGVAHGNISLHHIMLLPIEPSSSKYVFIDYSQSSFVRSENRPTTLANATTAGRDCINNIDSFFSLKRDILMLGRVFQEARKLSRSLRFLDGIISSMVHQEPRCRPSAAAAFEQLQHEWDCVLKHRDTW
ncbi:hypothetical protein FA95DRAFT_1561583 [Auriscalpium vulgare]|uniref:Uncharacterized protein n=1 Tax=Auriscalpium vulgare TaxID=40419 RepID=A0ACB8RMA6_9AGAM|nr:hypothetical protein FA95DRAFT_1561583 [Auriscalpium vulgare]